MASAESSHSEIWPDG
ncbi:hypothetical protein D030_3805A, partial [Vibrio parahaemolyticus AQ3810]